MVQMMGGIFAIAVALSMVSCSGKGDEARQNISKRAASMAPGATKDGGGSSENRFVSSLLDAYKAEMDNETVAARMGIEVGKSVRSFEFSAKLAIEYLPNYAIILTFPGRCPNPDAYIQLAERGGYGNGILHLPDYAQQFRRHVEFILPFNGESRRSVRFWIEDPGKLDNKFNDRSCLREISFN